jgi:Beta-glucosidase-related glycosidases
MKKLTSLLVALITVHSQLISYSFKPQTVNNGSKNGTPLLKIEEQKIDSIISVLTLEEKIAMVHGNTMFSSSGIERLGIPDLRSTDGPSGVREEVQKNSFKPLGLTTDSATFFPTGTALAATWNPDLALQYGIGLGEETRARGKDIILGPAINIIRTPVCGRTFEYMSEDPFLNSKLAVNYINGVQSCGVAACVKHYAANNQETNRSRVNVTMDERTLREIYLPAFKAAVEEANAYAIMTAYNKFRGDYCSENDYLLNKILKEEWNFKGLVMSDWGGTHSTVKAALNGLDLEMGTYRKIYFSQNLLDSVINGKVPEKVIDDKVRRILRVIFFNQKKHIPSSGRVIATPEHGKIAYEVASQSIVLLKNSENILPLDINNIKKIAIIGDNATHKHASGGFGAGVKARYEITPLEGLIAKIGNKAVIQFAQGYEPKFLPGKRSGYGRNLDNRPDSSLMREAVLAAESSDIAIIFAGTNRDVETEAADREDLTLPFGQDELIKAVAAVNPKTIVVIVAGAPVDLKATARSISTILYSWYNGSEGGNALADVLLGIINPSGKLPFTFPASLDDSPAHALKTFPGDSTVHYSEGILVGYRWFDTKNIKPLFCFGHGLSYTNFLYSKISTDKKIYRTGEKIKISLEVKNTGAKPGLETVQLYVNDVEPKVFKPIKELKAFKKIMVSAGMETEVNMEILVNDLAYFDEELLKWVVEPGKYKLMAGASSQDIMASLLITVE